VGIARENLELSAVLFLKLQACPEAVMLALHCQLLKALSQN